MHHEQHIPPADPFSVFLRVLWRIPHAVQMGVAREKGHRVLENEAGHLLRLHHDALQPGDSRTYYQSEHCVRHRTAHWCGQVLGFGSMVGEEVARGPPCKSLNAS